MSTFFFTKIYNFSKDFHKYILYQILRMTVQWEPSWYMRTDRHNETNRRFSPVCERA